MKYPKVKIDTMQTHANRYENEGETWDASTLEQYCKDNNYQPFDLPLAAVNLGHMPWDIDNISDFLFEVKRASNVDVNKPIILGSKGTIIDGWHRVCRAILDGKRSIKAIRLNDMPYPSNKE